MIMKNTILLYTMICVWLLFSGCEDKDIKADGTLSMKLRTWNNYESLSTKSTLNSPSASFQLPFVDVIGYKYEMKVTTDEIQVGMKDSDINWITIYESNELKGDSERDFEFQLPAGEYKAFALWQSLGFFWVGDHNGTKIQIPAWNGAPGVFEAKIYNVFANGFCVMDASGVFESVDAGEQIGASFIIEEGKTTTVTIRTNFTSIDWSDNDENGIWSEGDQADDPVLPDGVVTMSDFIVVYE